MMQSATTPDAATDPENPFAEVAQGGASTPRSTAAGSLVDDYPSPEVGDEQDGMENHHSLPNAEELKVSNPGNQGSSLWSSVLLGVIFLVVIVAITGLAIGVTADNRNESSSSKNSNSGSGVGAPTSGARDKQRLLMEQYLISKRVSTETDFSDSKSAQSRALNWLANSDKQRLNAPKGGLDSKEGYNFLTRYVMSLFYYATKGSGWNYDLLFLSEHETCDWYEVFQPPVGQVGVLCNQYTNEIIGVSFINNALEGTLPKEMAQLTTMNYLESIGNNIRGSIPGEYNKLTNLRTAVFAFNQLTGTIPTWIDQWPKLEFFFLSNNLFSGQVPTSFENLKELSVLALDDNALTGHGDWAWKLPKLEYLYLEDNDFTGQLPTSIVTTSPLLINLDISSNSFYGKLPIDLFRLTRLEILDLHDNTFIGSIPADINADNDRLEFVALHDNLLDSTIPPTLGNLRALKHLDLSANTLTGDIPLSLEELNELTYLFLSENKFTQGSIPTFMYTYDNLRELSLKNTQRTETISPLVELWDKLILLDLDNNFLTGAIPTEIGSMKKVQFLLLQRNELTQQVPSELGKLDNLRFILLDRNNVTGSLGPVCQNQDAKLSVAITDCDEVVCECCMPCCEDGTECHDYDLVSSINPVWERGYERQFFDFSNTTDGFALGDDDELVSAGSP